MASVLLSSLMALVAAAAFGSDTVPADPCATRKPAAPVAAFVVMPAIRARDSVVTAAVCVVTAGARAARVGSYHGELYFDSTAVRVLGVDKSTDGLRVENTSLAGRVNFAGAAPTGFKSRSLLSVRLRMTRPGARPRLRLKMLELNATDGSNMMKQLVTSAAP